MYGEKDGEESCRGLLEGLRKVRKMSHDCRPAEGEQTHGCLEHEASILTAQPRYSVCGFEMISQLWSGD
jgi:hypothetical protein